MVVGERGAGKTYGFKEKAFKKWEKTGKLWAYCRRNSDEIALVKNTLWNDFLPQRGYQTRVKKNLMSIRKFEPDFESKEDRKSWESENPWIPFGYFFALSEAQKYKSSSFPEIESFCFDEVIIENNRQRYINGDSEPELLLSLLDTIFRRRSGWKAYLISNAGAIANPYFRAWGVKAKDFDNQEFVIRGNVCFQKFSIPENAEENESSIIGMISTEKYKNYALKNEFADSGEEYVAKRPENAMPVSRITSDGIRWLTIYSTEEDWMWIAPIEAQVSGESYSLNKRKPIADTIYSETAIKSLKTMWNKRLLRFHSADAREQFLDWIQ